MVPDEEYMLQYSPILRWMLENDPTLRAKRVHGALRFHRRKFDCFGSFGHPK